MLRGQAGYTAYNEVIINTAYIASHLPQAVDAIFFVKGAPLASVARARQAHTYFLAEYGFDASTHPLLCLDPTDLERPFHAANTGVCRRT